MTYREPCPVCGHPTGDCVGSASNDIKIIGASIFPSLKYDDIFIVEEDVWTEKPMVLGQEWHPGGLSKKVRLFRKGQAIPTSVAISHNLKTA